MIEPRLRSSTLITLLAMSPLMLAVFLSLKSYEVWPQITYLWEQGAEPINAIAQNNPHALRYSLIYPILVISEQIGLDYDLLFTTVVLLVGFFTIRNLHRTSALISGSSRITTLSQFATAAFMTTLFFNMNGRISFAFLGYTMICLVIFRNHYLREFTVGSFLKLLVGLILASVSSGTLVSTTLAFLIGVYFEVFRSVKRGRLSRLSIVLILSSAALGVFYFQNLMAGIKKNIAYYGGDAEALLRMLEHGFGKALLPANGAIELPSAILIVLVIASLSSLMMSQMRHGLLLHLLTAAIACGAFGYSTLALAAIPLIILLSVYLTTRPKGACHDAACLQAQGAGRP